MNKSATDIYEMGTVFQFVPHNVLAQKCTFLTTILTTWDTRHKDT